MPRKKRWIAAGAAACAAMWFAYLHAGEQERRLPDGTTIALVHYDYGLRHTMLPDGMLAQFAALWQDRQVSYSGTPALGLELQVHQVVAAGMAVNSAAPSSWWDYAVVRNEKGAETISANGAEQTDRLVNVGGMLYPEAAGISSTSPAVESGLSYQTDTSSVVTSRQMLLFPLFPRSGRQVVVQFYKNGNAQPVAVFRVPNPVQGSFPVWQAGSLPQQQSDNAFTASLLRAVPARPQPAQPYGRLGKIYPLRLQFDIPEAHWHPAAVETTDAAGHLLPGSDYAQGDNAAGTSVLLPTLFCTDSPVANLRVRFQRGLNTAYPVKDVWNAAQLTLPAVSRVWKGSAVLQTRGATLTLMGAAGPGNILYGKGPNNFVSSDCYSVRVRVTPAQAGLQLLLHCVNQKGQACLSDMTDWKRPRYWMHAAETWQPGAAPVAATQHFLHSSTCFPAGPPNGAFQYKTFFFRVPPGTAGIRLVFALNWAHYLNYRLNLLHPSS